MEEEEEEEESEEPLSPAPVEKTRTSPRSVGTCGDLEWKTIDSAAAA